MSKSSGGGRGGCATEALAWLALIWLAFHWDATMAFLDRLVAR